MSEKTKGTCFNCKKLFSQSEAQAHLMSCIPLPSVDSPHYILKITAPESTLYWMYVAIPIKGTLYQLDKFLRDEWLECCGHLSSFRVGQIEYPTDYGSDDFVSMFKGKAASMRTSINKALSLGSTAEYEYDFGSTTELRIKVVAERSFNGKEIKLLMINENPRLACDKCKKSAAFIDIDGDYSCAVCAKDFDNEMEGLLPLVNSPRTGTCGYTGKE